MAKEFVIPQPGLITVFPGKKQLKLFHCTHDGKVIFGISIVLATSKKSATTMLKKKLASIYIDAKDSEINITEIDINTPSVHVLFDGVY